MIAVLDFFINMRAEAQKDCHFQQYMWGGTNENPMKAAFGIVVDQPFACYNTLRNNNHELLTYILY
jgi:hypothetical protein